ncbi:MAG: hypothetical protein AB3N63_09405 [Puniceicoccaceae bacterium]
MQMIETHQVLPLVLQEYPKSRKYFISQVEDWLPEEGEISPHRILSITSKIIKEEFLKGNYDDSEKLFELIEKFIREGCETVSNAACTNFIENLQNYIGSNGFESSHFISLLGPESRKYAKAWDKFTGVDTEGINDMV